MPLYHIPITGRLIDPVGEPVTGSSVYFTAKATSRGSEGVAKTTRASFTTDDQGYYSTEIPSGWYTIEYQRPGELYSVKLGVATVSGVDTLDLGTLIDNSIPPPSLLGQISDVDTSGVDQDYVLAYNRTRRKWVATSATLGGGGGTGEVTAAQLAATGAALIARDLAISGVLSDRLTSTGITLGVSVSSVSSNLATTGSTLDTKIGNLVGSLSGYSNTSFATIPNLAATGTTLDGRISAVSGNLILTGQSLGARIDTVAANLTTTGATLISRDLAISGVLSDRLVATGADHIARDLVVSGVLSDRLTATGATVFARDLTISGVLSDRLTSSGADYVARDLSVSGALVQRITAAAQGVSTINGISGVLTVLGTGTVTVTTVGQTIIVSGASGAAGGAGTVTQSQLDAVSGYFLTPPQINLGGGTGLRLNTPYYDGFSGSRTLGFVGAPSGGSWVTLRANVSGGTTLTFPTSYRIGETSSLTSLSFTPGNHELSWVYADSKYWLADSSSDGINLGVSGLNGATGALFIVGAGSVAVTTAGGVITVSGTSTGGGSLGLSPFVYATGGVVNYTADQTKGSQNLAITATGNVILNVANSWDGCGGLVTVYKTFAGTGSLTIPASGYIINGLGATVVPLSYNASGYDAVSFAYHKAGSVWAISTLSGTNAPILISGGGGGDVTSDQLTQTGVALVARDLAISGVLSAAMSPGFVSVSGSDITLTVDPSKAAQNLKILATGGDTTLSIAGSYNGANGLILVDKRFAGEASLYIPSGSFIINGMGATGLRLSTGTNTFDAFSFVYDESRPYWASSTLSGLLVSGGSAGGGGDVTQAQLTGVSGVLREAIPGTQPVSIPFVSSLVVATNATLAPQFFAGSSAYATYIDLSSYTGVQFIVNKAGVAGSANSAVFLRYLESFSQTPANYLPITSPEFRVPTNVQNVISVSGFAPIVAAARSGVYVALIASGGNGTLDPEFGLINARFL
jgi:hypothetical protein